MKKKEYNLDKMIPIRF